MIARSWSVDQRDRLFWAGVIREAGGERGSLDLPERQARRDYFGGYENVNTLERVVSNFTLFLT